MDKIPKGAWFLVLVAFAWFGTLLALVSIPGWYSGCRSAKIYNQLNGTSYTCSDFFWAEDQINSQVQTIKLYE